jgi:8-oxo-dGTP pyrophosphatase MutT (NUDIX family)
MEIMKTLKAKIPVCKAGGGFVHNKRVRFCLFSGTENGIYLRWNRKGGNEDTAMREVEEETGVNQLGYKKLQNLSF